MRYLDKLAEAKVDKGKTPEEKIKARVGRMGRNPDELEQKTRTGPVGDMARSKGTRKARLHTEEGPVTKAANKFAKKKEAESIAKTKKDYEAVYGKPKPKPKREDAHTSYQQIGDVLAEAMFGKIRTKAANKLDDISRKQYKKGESDEASGKPKRAGMRGRAAHAAGKLAQKVRPKDEEK